MKSNWIFDLDQTLVDSHLLEGARRKRQWSLVYQLISKKAALYDGMDEVLQTIRNSGVRIAIVSSAPRPYIERMVACFNIPRDVIIGYHDAPRKPSPAPMIKALSLLGASPLDAISFGDRDIDIISSRAAGVTSVACYWGTETPEELKRAQADFNITSPRALLDFLN